MQPFMFGDTVQEDPDWRRKEIARLLGGTPPGINNSPVVDALMAQPMGAETTMGTAGPPTYGFLNDMLPEAAPQPDQMGGDTQRIMLAPREIEGMQSENPNPQNDSPYAAIYEASDEELTKLMSRAYANRMNPIAREAVKAEFLRRIAKGRADPNKPAEAPEVIDINGVDHIWDGQRFVPLPNSAPAEPPEIIKTDAGPAIWQNGRLVPAPGYDQFPAPEDTSAAEKKIARLVEIGVPRDVAIRLNEGVFEKVTNPVTGYTTIVDPLSGNVLWSDDSRVSGADTPPEDGIPDAGPPPDLAFDDRFGDAPNAFGIEGAVRGTINTVADAAGFGPVWPETMQTQDDFRVFGESLLNQIASGYKRQPPSWLLQNIRDLIPQAGSPFVGPERAKSKLNALRLNILQEWDSTYKTLNGRDLSPQNKQEMEARETALRIAIRQLDDALEKLSGGGEAALPTDTAPAGMDDDLIEKWAN